MGDGLNWEKRPANVPEKSKKILIIATQHGHLAKSRSTVSDNLKRITTHSLTSVLTILGLVLSISLSAQTFKIYDGDTINRKDVSNFKQGPWKIFGQDQSEPGYRPTSLVEEGEYKDNRKQGVWIKYYPTGKKKSEITYVNNRPRGDYKVYYTNGQLEEAGTWKNNRNTGTFERFYENGQPQQKFNFDPSGKRTGKQTYFHENGKVMIEGEWNGGKEAGEVKEYYDDGTVKSIKVFNDGKIDPAKTQTFESSKPKPPVVEAAPDAASSEKVDVTKHKTNASQVKFDGQGFHILYNRDRQVSQKGEFKNYRLWNGKRYRYDDDGILQAIEIFKRGKYVGDGVIEEDDQ